MKTLLCLFLAFFILLPIGFLTADEEEPVPDKPSRKKTVFVDGTTRVTRRIAFLIDISGSMRGEELSIAHRELISILKEYPDDGLFKVYAFYDIVEIFDADTQKMKKGPDDDPDAYADENAWIRMPNREAVDKVHAWLSGFGGGGNTNMTDAFRVCFAQNKEDDTTIVLISDGEAGQREVVLAEAVEIAKKRNIAIHTVYVQGFGYGTEDGKALMMELAEKTGGHAAGWVFESKPETEPPPIVLPPW